MCRSRSEGGQRCVAHARASLKRAEERHEAMVALAESSPLTGAGFLPVGVQRRLLRAECGLADAMAQFASTADGRGELYERLDRALEEDDDDLFDESDESVSLWVALTEGQRLRERAAFILGEVRNGAMTAEEAKAASVFPSSAAVAFERSDLWLTGRETGFEDWVANRGSGHLWATQPELLGAAEQAYVWRRAEVALGRGHARAFAEAENDLFDARVRLVMANDEAGLRLLEAQRAGVPRDPGYDRERQALETAMAEGRRQAVRAHDLREQYALRLISRDQFSAQFSYPPAGVRASREQALAARFGPLRRGGNFNWR